MTRNFLLLGFHKSDKSMLINQIDNLGGKSLQNQGEEELNFQNVSAVIVQLNRGMSEKLKTPMATDVPILDESYIKDCTRHNQWLPVEYYDLGQHRFSEKCKSAKINIHHLEKRRNIRKAGGMLQSWTVVVLIENETKRKRLQRTIRLGGGKVLPWTIKHLLDASNRDVSSVNHIFTEPGILLEKNFQQFLEKHKCNTLPPITYTSYVAHFITCHRHSESEYSIFHDKVINRYCQINEDYDVEVLLNLAKRFTVGPSPPKRKRSQYYSDAELLTGDTKGTLSPTSPSFSPLASFETSQSLELEASFGSSQSPTEGRSAAASNSGISSRSSDVSGLQIESHSVHGIHPIIPEPPPQTKILPQASKARVATKKSSKVNRTDKKRQVNNSSGDEDDHLYEPPAQTSRPEDKQDQRNSDAEIIDIADSDIDYGEEDSDDDIKILAAEVKSTSNSQKEAAKVDKEEAGAAPDFIWGEQKSKPEPVFLKEPYEAVFDLFYNEDHADLCDRNRAVDKYKPALIQAYKKLTEQKK